jgi:hypothetical protein
VDADQLTSTRALLAAAATTFAGTLGAAVSAAAGSGGCCCVDAPLLQAWINPQAATTLTLASHLRRMRSHPPGDALCLIMEDEIPVAGRIPDSAANE